MKLGLFLAVVGVFFSITSRADFFVNSKRRDPNEKDKMTSAMVMIETFGGNCTGFFVKNKNNRLLIVTARHCGEYQFTKRCKSGSIWLTTEAGHFKGKCLNTLIDNSDYDVALFEAQFKKPEDEVRAKISFAQMSAKIYPKDTRLQLYGYPTDRRTDATVSENCWINNGKNIYDYFSRFELEAHNEERNSYHPDRDKVLNKALLMPYNCDVYGGNSGGPVTVENTDVVIGMPAGYYKKIFRKVPAEASSYFYSLKTFIDGNLTDLNAAEVEIEKDP